MLPGFGSGGRMLARCDSGTPVPLAAALLELAAVVVEALDQAADQVVRADVRDVVHHGGHVDDGVALDARPA